MAHETFSPPFTPPEELGSALALQGYAVLSAKGTADWLQRPVDELDALRADWDALPPDEYLKDGGRYRQRRHACFTAQAGQLALVPHRAHWQPVEYNALHGGMQRWFAPMLDTTVQQPAWQSLLLHVAQAASMLRGEQRWYIEAHQFRIDTQGGIGRPTPEGAHRDGVDLVAVALVGRHGIKGGETRVFEGRRGERFTLDQPWTLMLMDDARVIHESTPIQPLSDGEPGWRDTLVLTCRAQAFQGDSQA
ncbi:MAG: hypothetical protein EOO29_10090 [Comamonadaceae bacterium]|nr:MAG: hypothetical protein EOO29_10090 [Comamonadaceae bacterium]